MINVVIVCVNYNSYSELERYLKSIDRAFVKTDKINLKVYIADNSVQKESFSIKVNYEYEIVLFPNNGYFGSAFKIYNSVELVHESDYLIISNVDVQVDESFFKELANTVISSDIGWVAPTIYSIQEKRDKNPQRQKRPSYKKMKLLLFLFNHPVVESIYENSLYKIKNRGKQTQGECDIYCGHGSFIILTKYFINKFETLYYPCFLYCEELFLGELIRKKSLKVIYKPSLKVLDEEHCSTGTLSNEKYYAFNKDSLKYIMETFYK